jgi:branched-chain amino acid transport system ATP-binding protein
MSTWGAEPVITVRKLNAGYGKVHVLRDVDLELRPGEFVSLLGPNGAGKSTLLSAISSVIPRRSGRVALGGRDMSGAGARKMSRAGLAHVLEGHRIFHQLSILDNLLLAGFDLPRAERLAAVEHALSVFPDIESKRHLLGGSLSGGQQQMLAVAQAIVRKPKVLMVDEPSAGLSPRMTDIVISAIKQLALAGGAILLVEQAVEKAIAASDRVYAMSRGRIVLDLPKTDPELGRQVESLYLGGERPAASASAKSS